MAWLTITTWASGNIPTHTQFNNISLDIRTWGGNVDAGGYSLVNLGALTISGALATGPQTITGAVAITGALTATGAIASGARVSGTGFDVDSGTDVVCSFKNATVAKWAIYYQSGADGIGFYDWTAAAFRFYISSNGKVAIAGGAATVSGTGRLHVTGNTGRAFDTARTPASSSEASNVGEMFFDSTYLYVVTAANTIKRIALSAF